MPISLVQPDMVIKFDCSTTESNLIQSGAFNLTMNGSTVYFGTNQVSADNQNPIIVRFDSNGAKMWCNENYEITGADSRAIGLLWSSSTNRTKDKLYALFTTDGTQGEPNQDFRRYTQKGWLSSYGSGGGPKVTVIVELNQSTGEGIQGTFLRAQLSSGKTNTLVASAISMDLSGQVTVDANSYFLPLGVDKQPLNIEDCSPQTTSPFRYTITLSADLSTAITTKCGI